MAGLFKGIHGVVQDKTGVAAGDVQEAVTAVGEIPKGILDIIASSSLRRDIHWPWYPQLTPARRQKGAAADLACLLVQSGE